MAAPLLEVRDLVVHFETEDGLVKAVDGVSYTVDRGETLGIVGESGSGKSVSSLTVMGLTRSRNARITGKVRFDLPVIQGTVLFGAFFIVIMSLVVDILYAFIDPRVRY